MKTRIRSYFLYVATIFLVGAAICYQIIAEPIVGIADNGDFARITVRSGINHVKDKTREDKYFGYVNRKYELIKRNPSYCDYVSSQSIMIEAALVIDKIVSDDNYIDIRSAGLANALFLLGSILLIIYGTGKLHFYLRVLVAVMLFVLFTDGSRVCYLNSFYQDNASLIFLLASLGFALMLIYRAESFRKVLFFSIFYYVSAYLASIAKQQDILLIFPLTAFGYIVLFFRANREGEDRRKRVCRRGFLLIIPIALVCSSIVLFLSTGDGNKHTSLYNKVFHSVLRYAPEPEKALMDLGLSKEFAEKYKIYKGTSAWHEDSPVYTPEFGKEFFHEVSFVGLAKYHVSHPSESLEMVMTETKYYGDSRSYHLGNYERLPGIKPGTQSETFGIWSGLRKKLMLDWKFLLAFYFLNMIVIVHKHLKYDKALTGSLVSILHLAVVAMGILHFATLFLGDSLSRAKHFFLFAAITDICLVFLMVYFAFVVKNSNFREIAILRGKS